MKSLLRLAEIAEMPGYWTGRLDAESARCRCSKESLGIHVFWLDHFDFQLLLVTYRDFGFCAMKPVPLPAFETRRPLNIDQCPIRRVLSGVPRFPFCASGLKHRVFGRPI